MPTAKLRITDGDDIVVIDFDSFSAVDAKHFRAKVGVSMAAALADGDLDLDVLAGLLWLHRRRKNPTLTYEAVANDLSYASITNVEQIEASGVPDPEA